MPCLIVGLLLAASIPQAEIDRLAGEAREKLGLPGLSIGIVNDQQLVYAKDYGKADAVYPVGSLTKVFTASLLVIMRDAGEVQLDDPVARYLPAGVRLPADDRGAPAITLRHLATHTSGLPRIPVNLRWAEGDPYNGYSEAALLEGLSKTGLYRPAGASYSYSNLGYGLLGYALSRRAGAPYSELLHKRVFEPLGMTHTQVASEVTGWHLGALSPAGAVVSTVSDLARFVALQFRAGTAGAGLIRGGSLQEMQTPQRLTDPSWKTAVGLGWHISRSETLGAIVWHNGEVAKAHSYVAFLPERKLGVIVLTNTNRSIDGLGVSLLEAVAGPRPNPPGDMAQALCRQKNGSCKAATAAGQEFSFRFESGQARQASVRLTPAGKIDDLRFHPQP